MRIIGITQSTFKSAQDSVHINRKHKILIMKIPGLSFSWKRALGVSETKRKITRATGIPTTRNGLERKIGGAIINAVFGKKKT